MSVLPFAFPGCVSERSSPSISTTKPERCAVQIRIYRKYILRHNQDPTLVHGLLGGDTAIDFVPRREEVAQADRTPVEPGSELQGVPQATVSTLLNQASDVVPVAESALKEIRDSLKRLDKLTPILEETAKEYRDLAKATREVLPELKTTTKEVGDLAKAGREALPELKTTTKEVGDLAKAAQEALPDLRTTTKEVGDLAKDVRENVPELKKTITEAQVTLRTWDRLGEDARLLIRTNEDKVAKLLNDASDTLGRIGTLLSDENRRNFTATLKNVRVASERAENISKNTDEVLQESLQTVRRFNGTLAKTDEVLGDVQQATKPLGERGGVMVKNLEEASGRLNQVLADVQALFKTIDQGDGTLRRILTDPSLYNHIDQAALKVNQMLCQLDRVLSDVKVFADQIARHPEKLGVGGAIRPSSGLKEAPSVPVPWGKPVGY